MTSSITPIVGSRSAMSASSSSPRTSRAPMIPAACCAPRARRTCAPGGLPPVRARIATESPADLCASSVPAAPISTSSGWAPTASTISRSAARVSRPRCTSPCTAIMKSVAEIGFWMNSAADFRNAVTARSTVACPVMIATGRSGSSCPIRSSSSRPFIPGISRSVSTRSHGPSSRFSSPVAASVTYLVSNRPSARSSWAAQRPNTRSSSITRIRPRAEAGLPSSICPPELTSGRAVTYRQVVTNCSYMITESNKGAPHRGRRHIRHLTRGDNF